MNITRDQALLFLKAQDPADHFEIAKKTYNSKPTYVCPGCGNGSGEDGTGFHEDPERPGTYHCFKCQEDGDLLDFIALKQGLEKSSREVFDYAYQFYGLEIGVNAEGTPRNEARAKLEETTQEKAEREQKEEARAKYFEQCSNMLPEALDYLRGRGIEEETARKFNLGYDPAHYFTQDKKHHPVLIIPTSPGSYVARNLEESDKSNRWTAKGTRQPFNLQIIEASDEVYIVEGELDAISIESLGYRAVGLGSARGVLINKLKEMNQPPHLILSLDNDEGGQNQTQALERELASLDILYTKANIAGKYKDPNEALTKDKEGLKYRLSQGRNLDKIEAHKNSSAAAHLEAFFKAVQDGDYTPLCKTGFSRLDYQLGGGLHWGLYILGAISSLGKTTYMLQMMDQIARQGRDTLIFSLEMSRHELIAKSISRCTVELAAIKKLDRSNAKSSRAIMDGRRYKDYDSTEMELIKLAKKRYAKYADKLFIHEGQGTISAADMRKIVEDHIEITGNRPVVMLDYLQLIAPHNDRWTERQNIDHAISAMRVMARDLKVPVLAISSVNRSSYGMQEASISSFKESGGIEYGADTAFMLQFTHKVKSEKRGEQAAHERKEKQKTPREVELVILKNRNGITGESLNYQYFPEYNLFMEVDKLFCDIEEV